MITRTLFRQTIAASFATALLACCGTAQATYTTSRQSCPGSVGTPRLSAGAPIIGSTWTLTVTGLSPSTAGVLFFALFDDSFGPYQLPLDLGMLGAPAPGSPFTFR